MISTRANDNAVVVCYVNAVGGQDELVFDGHSVIFDETRPARRARAAVPRGRSSCYDIDVEGVMQTRLHDPRHRKERLAMHQAGTRKKIAVSERAVRRREAGDHAARLRLLLDPVAEVWEALVLGVRDYIGKTGFETVLIGLSGGVDSSLVAAIAVDALGAEHVIGVSMPSRFSSEGSKTDAHALAERLGIRCMTVPIEAAFAASLDDADRRRSPTPSSASPRRTCRRASAATS